LNPSFVIDCSITMTWCFDDEATDTTRAVARRLVAESVLVPSHWHLEVANVLLTTQRNKRLKPSDAADFVQRLSQFAIEVDPSLGENTFARLLPLSQKHKLTSYDAAYLELAMRTRLPLASLDKALRLAAAAEGVTLLGK
jgi:predicted nucleic acid-binding protein